MKKYIITGVIILLVISYMYINKDIYYIAKWHMYLKIENSNDTTTVYFSKSRWSFGGDYVKYRPQSAGTSYLSTCLDGDTLYAKEYYMKITKIQSMDYYIKPVYFIYGKNKIKGESDSWSDSTFLKEEYNEWIYINHRHGIFKGKITRGGH